MVAVLEPPGTLDALARWRLEHSDALTDCPDEAIQIDIGRADGGDFVRIRVADRCAHLFAQSA